MWASVKRGTVTALVVFGAYVFLAIPAWLNDSIPEAWNTAPMSWIRGAFLMLGPVAIGVAVYLLIGDEKQRNEELTSGLRVYLRRTFPNGWQRSDQARSLGDAVRPIELGLQDPADVHTIGRPPADDPAGRFLYRAGQMSLEDYVPCSVATAAMGVNEAAPDWALEVRACSRHYESRDLDAEATIGELAASARDRVHEAVVDQVAAGGVLRREDWVHLLSATCSVEIPAAAAQRLGVPDGSTFGDVTRRDEWDWAAEG